MSYRTSPLFADRADAGQQLAVRLMNHAGDDVVVAGMVRGGIPVAGEVARALGAPLVPIVVQKIGAPGQPELAMGAIAGNGRHAVWNDEVIGLVGADDEVLAEARDKAAGDLAERRRHYPGAATSLAGRKVILIDDGIATGMSIRAALHALRKSRPRSIVLAVPVILAGGTKSFADVADETVCLATPDDMFSVGEAYRFFGQVSHEQALDVLRSVNEVRPVSGR